MKLFDINLPPDLRSDGCTFPGVMGVFRGILGASRYEEYCREHDFLRRYAIVGVIEANKILAKRIATDGLKGKLRAPFYFLFTTISAPFYNNTKQLPSEWEEYAEVYR